MKMLWARTDGRGKVYFVSEDGGTVFSLKTARRKWPELVEKTAEVIERLKTEKVTQVKLDERT